MVLEGELEFLLENKLPPLMNFVLLREAETELFVQMPGRFQSAKGPEKYLPMARFPAECHGFLDEHPPDAQAMVLRLHYEPAKPGPFFICPAAVDGDGTRESVIHPGHPESVKVTSVPFEKLGQLAGFLNLEREVQPPVLVVVERVRRDDLAEGSGVVPDIFDCLPVKVLHCIHRGLGQRRGAEPYRLRRCISFVAAGDTCPLPLKKVSITETSEP